MVVPKKLERGDKVRVIAPSRSMAILGQETVDIATRRLNELGLEVSFAKNAWEMDDFLSSPASSRLDDLHEAFADPTVAGILTAIGGFNSNQLLDGIHYDLIRANPKILCGYSDITALAHAIYAKTGLTTYSGPHFSSFGMKKGFDYTLEHFRKCLMQPCDIDLYPAPEWSNDPWWMNQDDRTLIPNPGYNVVNRGCCDRISGVILGGNISALAGLHGTGFMPSFSENTVLFLEECEEQTIGFFDRILQSLLHQKDFRNVKAILLGRFEKATGMTDDLLLKIIHAKKALKDIPVISGMDFGHTTPAFTFPVGGRCTLTLGEKLTINIREASV